MKLFGQFLLGLVVSVGLPWIWFRLIWKRDTRRRHEAERRRWNIIVDRARRDSRLKPTDPEYWTGI